MTQVPDATGHFGPYGGMFVPETLMGPLHELAAEYEKAKADPAFRNELKFLLEEYAGRPTPLYHGTRMTERLGGAKIYLKREDLLHTGAHKINNALGQVLLARRMGKKRVIAETGAGQHGVATATVAAKFGLECVVYMGEVDMVRQALNVTRMRLLGAKVVPVTAGQKTLKEAVNEAMRDWVTNVRSTHYILGSALGSHPYPMMVRDFHRVIGDEARRQILEREEHLPDVLIACVGGGSNAIGLFYPFLEDTQVRCIGVEAGGYGIMAGQHAARFQGGSAGGVAGRADFYFAGQQRADHEYALDFGGAGLRGGGAGACVAARRGAGGIHVLHGRRGAEGVSVPERDGGDHSGDGERARDCGDDEARADAASGPDDHREFVRARGQGRAADRAGFGALSF